MVLTFLGTSHGVPEKNRKCSSILLEVGENKYLIDMGCDVSSILTDKGISLDKINAVFITHQHGDHTNGLFAYTELCNWYYTSGEQNIFIPRHELREFITSWLGLNGQKEMRSDIHFYEYSEGLIYEDEKIKVTAYLTGHIKYSYAFIIEAEGKRLFFSGDMKTGDGPIADYDRITKGMELDLCVCECSHFDALLYLDPLTETKPKKFVINHYLEKYRDSCLALKSALLGEVEVVLAEDDMEIDLLSI